MVGDPKDVALAAVARARDLLAEDHQLLTMTAGDARALLERYQRMLENLADVIGHELALVSTTADEMSADASVLEELQEHWQDSYYIKVTDGTWSASPRSDRTVILTASHPWELKVAIQNDYAERISRKTQE